MRTAVSLLVAATAAVVLGIALAFAAGGLSPAPAALALLGGAFTGAFCWRMAREGETAAAPIRPIEWFLIAILAIAGLRAFLWLLFVEDNAYHILSPNNLGDLPLHLDFIRYLASGVRFWPETPIFCGEPLKYPIGADFFNSLLLLAGLPVERGLVWTALAGTTLTGMALWRWGRGFAIAAFLFGGGLTAFALLSSPSAIIHEPIADYQAQQTWKNLFLALFVTQRGLLFALPAGLFLLDDWRSRYVRGERGILPGWAALLLYAAMPVFNVHAFLYLSVALAGMFVFAQDAAARREALRFTGLALIPATLCAALVTGGFSAGGGVHWAPGWMQDSEKDVSAWWFWLRNFGLYLVLSAGLVVAAIIHGPRETRAIVLPAALVFIACCFISFAPWEWDNTKLLLWCWLAVAPCLWADILGRLHTTARWLACFVLFFTGAVSLVAGLDKRHDYMLADLAPLGRTADAVKDIAPDSRFACAPEYAHPLLILGRKMAVGYPGHLWSHGITYRGRNADKVNAFEDLMRGARGWEACAAKLGVDYIYWGPLEDNAYSGSLKPWEKALPIAARGKEFVIYKLPLR